MAAKRVDVLNVRCNVEIDAKMIQEKILSLPEGGDQINRMVERVRMRAMVEQFQKQPWFAQTTTNGTPGKAGPAGARQELVTSLQRSNNGLDDRLNIILCHVRVSSSLNYLDIIILTHHILSCVITVILCQHYIMLSHVVARES